MQLAARWSCTYALLRVARARGTSGAVGNRRSRRASFASFSFALIGNGRTGYRSRGRDTLPGNGDGHSKVRHALGHYTFGDDPHLTHIHFGQKGMFNSLHAAAFENTQEYRRICKDRGRMAAGCLLRKDQRMAADYFALLMGVNFRRLGLASSLEMARAERSEGGARRTALVTFTPARFGPCALATSPPA